MNLSKNRRDFLKQAAAISSFFIVPRHVLGRGFLAPSDVIQLGFLGAGKQSETLLKRFLDTKQARILAIADPHKLKLERFLGWHQKQYAEAETLKGQTANEVQTFENYLEVLHRKDIDAAVIITPDHWHAVMAIQAARVGKDIYGEKPLSLTVKEGRAMVDAVRKNNRVFQTGSMQRSWPNFRKACELVRNGYIGTIKEVQVNIGNPPKVVDFEAEPLPDHLNWPLWLGPNDAHIYHHFLAPRLEDTFWAKWRDYKPFGGGGMTDWGAHMFDIAQWALDMDESGPVMVIPPSTIPESGEIRGLEYHYGNGVVMKHFNFGINNAVRFIGTEGQIDISRQVFKVPEKLIDLELRGSDLKLPAPENHYLDFINSMRTRSKPICDIEIGHRTATVCNIGNIAYQLRRPLEWNPKKELFKKDKEANALLTRKHWEQSAGLKNA